MDRKYARVTVSIDATHRLWNKDHTGKKSLYDWSYKLKDFGYNVLFGGFVNGYFFFLRKGVLEQPQMIKLSSRMVMLSLCDVLDENYLIICDGIFRDAIRTEDRRNTLICPWTKPKGAELPLWKLRENKEISEQRGPFERHIGRLVNRFNILSKKFRHDKKYIRDVILFLMSLHNLKEHGMIILSEYLRSESDITRYESENDDYFSEEIVTIGGDRDYLRIEEEEEAYLNADSVSNFLINFERNLTMILELQVSPELTEVTPIQATKVTKMIPRTNDELIIPQKVIRTLRSCERAS